MRCRPATPVDAPAIAALHAESWRATYRGMYRDAYLDGDLVRDRLEVWENRLSSPSANQCVVIAECDDGIEGFACVFGGADPQWGTLLDNLHVRPGRNGQGLGGVLLSEASAWCDVHHPRCGMFLWILDLNRDAQRFYRRLGATDRGEAMTVAPGGGSLLHRRFAWNTMAEVVRTPHR